VSSQERDGIFKWGYLEFNKGDTLGRELSSSQRWYNTPSIRGKELGGNI